MRHMCRCTRSVWQDVLQAQTDIRASECTMAQAAHAWQNTECCVAGHEGRWRTIHDDDRATKGCLRGCCIDGT